MVSSVTFAVANGGNEIDYRCGLGSFRRFSTGWAQEKGHDLMRVLEARLRGIHQSQNPPCMVRAEFETDEFLCRLLDKHCELSGLADDGAD